MFHISALPSAGPRFSTGGGGGSAVCGGEGGAVPEDFEVALEEEEPVERRMDDVEDAVTRVLVADPAVLIVLERVEVAPVDRLELLTVLAVEVALEEEPVERRMDDETPVDRLTLLAVLAVEVGFEEEGPAERRTDDDREDVVTRVPVADTAVFVLVRFEEVPPVERLTLLAVLPVENGFEEEEPVERRTDDAEVEVNRVLVAETAVFIVLVRFEVTPVERLTLLALLPVENGFEEAVELRLVIAEGEDFVESPVLNVMDDLVDLVPELALIDSLDAVPVLRVIDGLDKAVELRLIVAEDDLVDIPVLNMMEDLMVEEILELALRDGLDVAPVPELGLIDLDVAPVLELALIDGLELTPDPELPLIDVLDVTPVLELALIDGLDETPVPELAEGFEEVAELNGGFDEDAVPRDAEGLEEVPELKGGFDEDAVLSDAEGLEEVPELKGGFDEAPVLSDAEGLEEVPVLKGGFDEDAVPRDAEGLEEVPELSSSNEDLDERVGTVLALEELGVTVIVGVVSIHEQMVLMNCGSCVKQDAHIEELAALSVGETAVIVFLSFLPDLSSSRFSRSSRSSTVTVTVAMGKFREQYASAGG